MLFKGDGNGGVWRASMKIAIIGYGKMGQMIEKMAVEAGHSIEAYLTSKPWHSADLKGADVCIEFTHPEAVLENIKKAAEAKKPIVIGTTGWEDQREVVQSIITSHQIGAIYSPNFSIGIHLMLEILSHASKIMNGFEQYDTAGMECHHRDKKDSPSGTALAIAEILKGNIKRLEKVPFSSLRCGSIPGTHTVFFDSPFDTITITHEARNREGFARGAIQAAEWLKGKNGLYSFADCIQEIIKRGRK
jgi:4-hydroxy-tetrahydrodipicolinate reductase